jgi:hypothetical protein
MRRSIRENENAYFYLLVPLLVYTLKAIILLRGGKLYGRLALPPPYDDVSYFVDAAGRVRIFLDQGFSGFVQSLITNPPHAPYSTIAAAVAFLFGGPSLAGPYLMNGVMAAALSALLFRLFRVGALTTCCICIVLVTTAWFDNLVTIFHPDLLSGFGAAIMAAVLIWQNEIIQHRTHALLVGTAGGFILLTKPTAIVMLTILWPLAFLVGAALAYREEKSLRRVGMRLFFIVLPILVIAGPYFAHELASIIEYDIRGFVHERKTWMGLVPAELRSMYYLNAARASFGCWLFVAAGGGLGIIVADFFIGDDRTALRFAGLIFLSLVAYLIPASVDVKDYVYGGVIYGCIAVCLILVIHFLADRLRAFWPLHRLGRFQLAESSMRNTRVVALILIGLFAVTGLADKQDRYPRQIVSALRAEFDGVYRLLKEVLVAQQGVVSNGSPTLLAYFPCPAPVAPHAYRFHALLDGLDFELEESPHQSNLQELVDVANRAKVIVVPDDESLKSIYPYPVTKLIPAFRKWLDGNIHFKRIGTVRTSLGGTDLFAITSVPGETTPGSQGH